MKDYKTTLVDCFSDEDCKEIPAATALREAINILYDEHLYEHANIGDYLKDKLRDARERTHRKPVICGLAMKKIEKAYMLLKHAYNLGWMQKHQSNAFHMTKDHMNFHGMKQRIWQLNLGFE